MDLETLLSG